MHLESLIEELGGFGRFQRRMVFFLISFHFFIVPTMLTMVFAGVEPTWWCLTPGEMETPFRPNVSRMNCFRNQTCTHVFSEEMVTVVSDWDLTCDLKDTSSNIIMAQMAGVLLGAIISGYVSDSHGRKTALYSGTLLCFFGNIISPFSVSWIMYIVLRFELGFSLGMSLPVLYLYQVEFVSRKWRSLIASLPAWASGTVLFASMVWILKNWKWVHLTIAAVCVPYLLSWFYVPESIRWLTIKGRLEEAKGIVQKMASVNEKPMPDTAILELIAKEELAEGDKAKTYSYKDLLRTWKVAKKTICSCYIWFCMSVVYYTIAFGVKNLSGNFFVNLMIMSVLELPTFVIMVIMSHAFSRQWACALLFLSGTVTTFSVAAASRLAPEEIKGTLETGLAIAAKILTICGWGITQAFSSEQFPTVIRNRAFATQDTFARLGGFAAAQIVSLGNNDDLMPPFLAMGILLMLTALACFALEETKKKALEDTMETEIDKIEKLLPVEELNVQKTDFPEMKDK